MSAAMFDVGAEGIDTERLVADIQARVEEKRRSGIYTDARIARAERANLAHLRGDQDFLSFYLQCLREAVFVDINDFEIVERRARWSGLLVALKRTIWKLLKFYTYRLWSQQNQINGLMLSAVESADSSYRERMAALEKRVAELEAGRERRSS